MARVRCNSFVETTCIPKTKLQEHVLSTPDIGLIIRHAEHTDSLHFCRASIFNLHGLCQPVISLSDCREGLQDVKLFR